MKTGNIANSMGAFGVLDVFFDPVSMPILVMVIVFQQFPYHWRRGMSL
jgi:hypothetical protein